MSAWYVRSDEMNADVAGNAQRHQTRRHVLSFSAPVAFFLVGALSACGKRGELEAPPLTAETVGGEEESAE